MKRIFDEENRLKKYLEVEVALVEAHAEIGNVPKEAAKNVRKSVSKVKLERVKEIEEEVKHDLMAVVKAFSEVCGTDGGYIHLGATSNDIIDTAIALQFKEGLALIAKDLVQLRNTIAKLAKKHKNTLMLGRTHGQAALPITFGLKLAVWAFELDRHLERLMETSKRVEVGKMLGAVGTGAAFGKNALRIQKIVMKKLGLGTPHATTQILGRDRYAELVCVLANIASSLEKFATEIRNLQRNEIDEVSEGFKKSKQVGSSTMPQKRNPILSENIVGLGRIVRAFVLPAFENISLWHERDLTNSSSERFIIPHVFVILDDMLFKMNEVISNLEVKKEKMLKNIEDTKGYIMAESVMIRLSEKIGRQEAHELIRKVSLEGQAKGIAFKEALLSSMVAKYLSKKEIEDALQPRKYLGIAENIVDSL
ncbi:MAG: adenylosuccinate lyase [Thermoplasmata archaeon]